MGLPEDEGGITITKAALAHVLERHSVGGSMTMGKSVFLAGEDIVKLVRDAKAVTPVKQQVGKYFERIIDAGRPIGTDRVTGTATSIYTVITNAAKELVTAFPGTP